jgi:hypothetical protein
MSAAVASEGACYRAPVLELRFKDRAVSRKPGETAIVRRPGSLTVGAYAETSGDSPQGSLRCDGGTGA